MFSRWLFWPLFAAFMAFEVGGSVVWAVGPPNQEQHATTALPPSGDTKQRQPAKTFGQRLTAIWDRTWEDPVAFYTLVLAIFTLCLVVVSIAQGYFLLRTDKTARISAEAAQKAGEAADLSAKSALRLEQPILTMRTPELSTIKGNVPKDRGYATAVLTGLPWENCVVAGVAFENRGRTTAFADSLHLGYSIARVMPPRPSYSRVIHFRDDAIIQARRARPFPISIDFDFDLQDWQRAKLREGEILWFWCLIVYIDFMDMRWGKEFGWQWTRYPEDHDRDDAYHFMGLRIKSKIDPELLRDDYRSAAD
jgi:hypothetical protein